jgi:hypothetical protein
LALVTNSPGDSMSRRELAAGIAVWAVLFNLILVGGCATLPKPAPKPAGTVIRFADGVQPRGNQLHVCGTYEGAFTCISWEHFQEVSQAAGHEKAQLEYEL